MGSLHLQSPSRCEAVQPTSISPGSQRFRGSAELSRPWRKQSTIAVGTDWPCFTNANPSSRGAPSGRRLCPSAVATVARLWCNVFAQKWPRKTATGLRTSVVLKIRQNRALFLSTVLHSATRKSPCAKTVMSHKMSWPHKCSCRLAPTRSA